jgi:glutaminyl-peptide cyclotransferase
MSDGTNKLTYLDAETLQPVKILIVTENSSYKNYLNELEFIDGFIYANIWLTNTIVKIDTFSGNIVGKMDLTPFTEECKSIYDNSNVLNGIAYDSVTNTVFLTGKLWPRLYQIRIKD